MDLKHPIQIKTHCIVIASYIVVIIEPKYIFIDHIVKLVEND